MSVSIRQGKYMLRTGCGKCKAVFSSVDRAMNHMATQHRAKKFVPPVGDPLFKVRWNRKGMIAEQIMLGMEMGEQWDAVTPENIG